MCDFYAFEINNKTSIHSSVSQGPVGSVSGIHCPFMNPWAGYTFGIPRILFAALLLQCITKNTNTRCENNRMDALHLLVVYIIMLIEAILSPDGSIGSAFGF